MSQVNRLEQGGRINRFKTLNFTFNNKTYQGFEGDTLASALLANGVDVVGRSFKYSRPRGIITADAQDVGSGSETLSSTFQGDDIQIAFNVRYVLDGLKAIESDRITLRCNAPTTPAVFCPTDEINNFVYLVMPVQIRN